MDANIIVSLLLQQSQEIENSLQRKILDLQIQLIAANERIAELEGTIKDSITRIAELQKAKPADTALDE